MAKRKAPKRVKVGKCWYVCGYDGKPINGLSWDKSSGYYYATHYKEDERWQKQKTKTPIRFGKDYATAISLFRGWQQQDSSLEIDLTTTVRVKRTQQERDFLRRVFKDGGGTDEAFDKLTDLSGDERVFGTDLETALEYQQRGAHVDYDVVLPKGLRVQIVKDFFAQHTPAQLAELLGIPNLANLDLVSHDKPISLEEVYKAYMGQAKIRLNRQLNRNQRNEIQKVEATWRRFLRTTKAKTLKDITVETLTLYYEAIYDDFLNSDKSTTYFNGNMERVKRVFHAYKSASPDYAKAILLIRNILKGIKHTRKTRARMISRVELEQILNQSSIMEKAIWLVSLNCALYGIEVARLREDHIDFARKTCVYRRSKNDNHRAAILWDETIQAMQAYKDQTPHADKTFFVSSQGSRFSDDGVGKLFSRFKKRIGLPEGISHDNFRDSFLTVGKLVKRETHIDLLDSIRVVLGHQQYGSEGNYIDPEAAPEIAAPACKAVHDYYFGEGR